MCLVGWQGRGKLPLHAAGIFQAVKYVNSRAKSIVFDRPSHLFGGENRVDILEETLPVIILYFCGICSVLVSGRTPI